MRAMTPSRARLDYVRSGLGIISSSSVWEISGTSQSKSAGMVTVPFIYSKSELGLAHRQRPRRRTGASQSSPPAAFGDQDAVELAVLELIPELEALGLELGCSDGLLELRGHGSFRLVMKI